MSIAPNSAPTQNEEFVLSYHRVRQTLGFLGMLLPLSLILGTFATQNDLAPSISDFYATTMRDVFVGNLCAIGVFLISYKGYKPDAGEWISDDWVATLAGIAAFGVAFFPNNSPTGEVTTITQALLTIKGASAVHYASAITLFSCFTVFCYTKFPKTSKPHRRRIYMWCGHVLSVSTVLIIVASAIKVAGSGMPKEAVDTYKLVFWFEAIGIWAFAVSWLTKGRADMMLGVRSIQIDDELDTTTP